MCNTHLDAPGSPGPSVGGGKPRPFSKLVAPIGRLAGRLAFVIDWRHRHIVTSNLAFANPHWSREKIRRLSRHVFEHITTTLLEIWQINRFSRQQVLDSVCIRGVENLHLAARHPRGAIIISAHFGNWELGVLFLSCFFETPLVSVVRPLRYQWLERWLYRFRTRFGHVVIDKKNALRPLMKALRNGNRVGVMIDQEPKHKDGAAVRFFGRKVTTTGVATLLARRYDVPVIPIFSIREKDGSMTIHAKAPLKLKKTDDVRADFQVNTQLMTHAIEDAVREYPAQWFWVHKRWKKHYPHLYRDLSARQRRRDAKKRNRNHAL